MLVDTDLCETCISQICGALALLLDGRRRSKVSSTPVCKTIASTGTSVLASCRVKPIVFGFGLLVDGLDFVFSSGSLRVGQILVVLLVQMVKFTGTCRTNATHLLTHHLREGATIVAWHIECAFGAFGLFFLSSLLHVCNPWLLESSCRVWLPLGVVQDIE